MESGVDVVVERWCAKLGFSGSGSAFSSLPFVAADVADAPFLPELLDRTVESAGRLWRTRITLMSGTTAERGAELPRTIVSLESPDECWVLTVSVRAIATMAVSLLFLRCELLVAEGGRACGVLHRDELR
jgi:hypothetical protein